VARNSCSPRTSGARRSGSLSFRSDPWPTAQESANTEVTVAPVETAARTAGAGRITAVVRRDLTIENGSVTGFRVRLGVSFKYDTGD
jgi:flavin-binding protein dodecin